MGKDVIQEKLEELRAGLNVKEQDELDMRLGLNEGYPLSPEEAELYLKISKERIEQQEAKAKRHVKEQ